MSFQPGPKMLKKLVCWENKCQTGLQKIRKILENTESFEKFQTTIYFILIKENLVYKCYKKWLSLQVTEKINTKLRRL